MFAFYGSDEVRSQIETVWAKKKFDLHGAELKEVLEWIKYKPVSYVVFSLSGQEDKELLADMGEMFKRFTMIKFVWMFKGAFPIRGYSRRVLHYFIDGDCSNQTSLAAYMLNIWNQRELLDSENKRMPMVRLGAKWEIKQVAEG